MPAMASIHIGETVGQSGMTPLPQLQAGKGIHHTDLTFSFFTVAFESLLVGIFFVLTSVALYLWTTRSRGSLGLILSASQRPSSTKSVSRFQARTQLLRACSRNPLVFGSLVLLLCILLHWICTLYRLLQAVEMIKSGESPIDFYENYSHPSFILMSSAVTVGIPIADSLLIWRLWVVSGRSDLSRWLILPPIITAVGFTVCGVRVTTWFALGRTNNDFYSPEVKDWILCNVILTAFANVYCTICLTSHIYKINSKTSEYTKVDRKPVLVVIIESAGLYRQALTVAKTMTMLTSTQLARAYQSKSTISLLAFDNGPAVAGIAFMLINVRAALGWDIRPEAELAPLPFVDEFRNKFGIASRRSSSLSSMSFVSVRSSRRSRRYDPYWEDLRRRESVEDRIREALSYPDMQCQEILSLPSPLLLSSGTGGRGENPQGPSSYSGDDWRFTALDLKE
ncbi:hypothetical protein FA15DRAFT_693875 [Coprinopsis marcescibilis]|uniref:Uncharacterized protein n=1 Tax=Coprinopsis marcescibilis TaxID=230819 RepID=A0A5C3KYA1_COPMA|nr:hypothetical protein FA15DRAFT_693875 [Coprinopsis marcescibilis]